MNCCPGSMDCGKKERQGVRSGYSTVGHCSTRAFQSGNLHLPAHLSPGQMQLPWVPPAAVSSQTTPKPSLQWDLPPVTCRQSSPSLGQPAADEPSPPLSLRTHPFLWSYPSAEIWSYARTPQRPDRAVLDLAVLLAVELQSLEI